MAHNSHGTVLAWHSVGSSPEQQAVRELAGSSRAQRARMPKCPPAMRRRASSSQPLGAAA